MKFLPINSLVQEFRGGRRVMGGRARPRLAGLLLQFSGSAGQRVSGSAGQRVSGSAGQRVSGSAGMVRLRPCV
ncbi:MAG: hypothetical protein OXH24_01270 [Cyanobacteria bacterium MAG IRC3_bin_20]|nr:hypothetical protein [Cyanobacteria bacterium MAG IRC3_bin_20]